MKPRHALWSVRGQPKHDSPSGARASSANARKEAEIFFATFEKKPGASLFEPRRRPEDSKSRRHFPHCFSALGSS
jgi:hypothetical protein